jgi:Mor family transcriptional regulator
VLKRSSAGWFGVKRERRMSDIPRPNDLAPLAGVMPENLHPTLREMVEQFFLFLMEDEQLVQLLSAERIAELVVGAVDRLALSLGGSSFYLPRGIGGRLSVRDQAIGQAFNGRNKHQLAQQHGVSEMRIDQIFKRWRAEQFARLQGRLDLGDSAA